MGYHFDPGANDAMAKSRRSRAIDPAGSPDRNRRRPEAQRPPAWRPVLLAPLSLVLAVVALYATCHTEFGVDTWVSLAGVR